MPAKLALLRSLVPVPRRKTTAIRCALAAALFLAFLLFHTSVISPDTARTIGWTSKTIHVPDSAPPTSTEIESAIDSGPLHEDEGGDAEPVAPGEARPSKLGDAVMALLESFPPSETVPDWTGRFDAQVWHWGGLDPANVTDKLTLEDAQLATIKRAHQGFVDAVNTRLPAYVPHRYGSSSSWAGGAAGGVTGSPTRGIVIVGGGKFSVILSVSLRFLRRTGTTLPAEVFVTEGEYEKDVCDNLLPSLNATCRVYPKMHTRVSKGFQLKAFAMLFSSFDEILLLDADNTAMRNVAPLFDSPPFQETGLVVWPDFWQTTVSPLYYDIAGTAPVPVSARPSSESGQLLIDKARHWKTLLLCTYYNFYGLDFYYRLLNQGYTGMGDKETILPAAAVFGLPFYQVHMPLEKVGHRFEDGSVGGRVIIQYDPGADWAITKALASADEILDAEGSPVPKPATEKEWKSIYHQHVPPVFLHTNWPKWDPTDLLSHVSKWSDMTMGVSGEPEAAFSYPPAVAAEIQGTERILWEEALWLACHMRTRFRHWRNSGKAVHLCAKLKRHFASVFDTDEGKAMGLGPDNALFPKLPDEGPADELKDAEAE